MAGTNRPSNPNIPSHLLEQAVETARNAEYTGTPFTDTLGDGSYADPYLGCNRAGACSPGIGINSGDYQPELRNWDGDGGRTARLNQASAHIGSGDDGQGGNYPSSGITTDPLRTAGFVAATWDFNDQFGFQQDTGTSTAPDAVIANGVINRTGLTIPANEWAWGTITVAGVSRNAFITQRIGTGQEDAARVRVTGDWQEGQQIRVVYKVDDGPDREVVYDVLSAQDAVAAALGLLNEFVVDPDVRGMRRAVPDNHVALWKEGGTFELVSVNFT